MCPNTCYLGLSSPVTEAPPPSGGGVGVGSHVPPQKSPHLLERRDNERVVEILIETVTTSGDRDQLVLDPGPIERRGHHDRLLVRNVGVPISVEQQRRGIFGGHVLDRTVLLECLRLAIGVVTARQLGPEPLLPAVEVESPAAVVRFALDSGYWDRAYAGERVGFRHERPKTIVRIGSAIPLTNQIAVTVERHQGARARPDSLASQQSKIAAGRGADDADPIGVEAKAPGAV